MPNGGNQSGRLRPYELAQMELRLARATPGPWVAHHDQVLADEDVVADICCAALEQSLADAHFISSARQDVERLTQEIRTLWEELDCLRNDHP